MRTRLITATMLCVGMACNCHGGGAAKDTPGALIDPAPGVASGVAPFGGAMVGGASSGAGDVESAMTAGAVLGGRNGEPQIRDAAAAGAAASAGPATDSSRSGEPGPSGGSGEGPAGGRADSVHNDVVGAPPPMGWNSWNTFGCNTLNEVLVRGVADAVVSSGMKDAGYQYVNLDDCWMNGRDASGTILVNTSKFPSGMTALANYVHDKGLKIGLYSTPGTRTCAAIYGGYSGGVGSLNHEAVDAKTYASWGIDYLEYDKCTASLDGFVAMRDALRATPRPIFYSINPGDGTGCVPGQCSIDLPAVANMWRIGFDINASWSSVVALIDQNAPLSRYAGPGHWNDPDMLEVGKLANETEDRAHFSMWAIMAAPLLAGNDVRNMSATTTAILTNREVITVDQDPLGIQGKVVATPAPNLQVWAKKLSRESTVAVALLNRSGSPASITVQWSDIGLSGSASVRDLWAHSDLGRFDTSYTAQNVPPHGVSMVEMTVSP